MDNFRLLLIGFAVGVFLNKLGKKNVVDKNLVSNSSNEEFSEIRFSRRIYFHKSHIKKLFALMAGINASDVNLDEEIHKYIEKMIEWSSEEYVNKIKDDFASLEEKNEIYDNIYDYLLFGYGQRFFYIESQDEHYLPKECTVLNIFSEKYPNSYKRLRDSGMEYILSEHGIYFTNQEVGGLLLNNCFGFINELLSMKLNNQNAIPNLSYEINYYLGGNLEKLDKEQIKLFDDFCKTFSKALLCTYMLVNENKIFYGYDKEPIGDFCDIYLFDRLFDFKTFGEIEILEFNELLKSVEDYVKENKNIFNEVKNGDKSVIEEHEKAIVAKINALYPEHNLPIEKIMLYISQKDPRGTDVNSINIRLWLKYCFYDLDIDFTNYKL